MALAGELTKYIGGELAKNSGKELATKAVASTLSSIAPNLATKAGAKVANKIGNEFISGSILNSLAPTTRMLDKAGNPVTLYHSTPNTFDKFDDAMLGTNTGYDNTALGHFVTTDKDFSKRFIDIDNLGKTGRTMELQGNIQKPITHPYMAGYKYDNKDLDKIVEDYLLATDNPEFLDELKSYALDDNSNLYDEYMNMTIADSPFEVAVSDRQSLMNKGYDAVEIIEGPKSGLVEGAKSNAPISSYAVFNGENLRPVRHFPVEESSSLSSIIPVKRKLYRGQQYSNTDFSYNSELMNENPDKWGSKDVGKGYHFTPKKDMAGSWEGSDGGVIEVDYTPDQVLKADDARKMIEEANKLLADDKYMAKLWQENEAMAEQIEKIADGDLEALAKREGKPFVQHLKANDDELGTMYYYKDIDPELTDRFVSEFKKKAEKYIPNNNQQVDELVMPDAKLSPQQQEFFKDSVVRDENGDLIPMYHGTRGDFTIFGDKSTSSSSNSHSSVGYWFTPNEEGAKNFAESIWYGDGQPKTMKTYLNIKNPKVYESVDNSKAVDTLRDKLNKLEIQSRSNSSYPKLYYKNMYHASVVDNMVNQGNKDMAIKWLAEKSGYDEKTATDLVEEIADRRNLEVEKKKLEDEIAELKYSDAYERFRTDIYKIDGQKAEDANVGGIGMALNDTNSVQKYVDKLKSEGYDGIIIKGTHYDADTMGGINDQYVVFDPEQIKDVNNLNPTTNPDINYSEIATVNGGVLDEKTNRAIEIINQANNFGSPVKNKLYDKIDPSTLPKGYSELSKLLDSASSSDNVIAKRVAEKIGTDSPLDADLDKVLDYLYVGDNREKRVFKQVLEDKIKKFEKDAKALGLDIDDPRDRMTKSEMYKLFGKAWDKAKQEEIDKIVQMSDGADIMNALIDTAHRGIRTGTAGGLDTALSERLGIAPGNTIKISSDRYGDYGNPQSAGRYNRYYKDIAINSKGSKVESQVSTMAHERLHSFQNEARPDNLGRYSKEVSDAYLELQKDLTPFLKSKDEIANRYGRHKADYWASDIEQEARMLQNYLENTGITNNALSSIASGEWGDEINPAFDKFFEKLRKLSKKGIALPAVAGLVGIGTLAGKKDDESVDNKK